MNTARPSRKAGTDAFRPGQLCCHGLVFRKSGNGIQRCVLQLMGGEVAHVPALWPLEFSNVLRKSISGKNISEARARAIIAQNDRWKILVDTTAPKPGDFLSLSLAYGLSSYDAAYLYLAIRLHLPIAAKDGALRGAAVAAGVGIFEP